MYFQVECQPGTHQEKRDQWIRWQNLVDPMAKLMAISKTTTFLYIRCSNYVLRQMYLNSKKQFRTQGICESFHIDSDEKNSHDLQDLGVPGVSAPTYSGCNSQSEKPNNSKLEGNFHLLIYCFNSLYKKVTKSSHSLCLIISRDKEHAPSWACHPTSVRINYLQC